VACPLQSTARERETWFLPSLLSWLGVGAGSDKSSVLVESCAGDVAWYTYTALRASEEAQPDMSLELWTELQMEMSASSTVSVEQALTVCCYMYAHTHTTRSHTHTLATVLMTFLLGTYRIHILEMRPELDNVISYSTAVPADDVHIAYKLQCANVGHLMCVVVALIMLICLFDCQLVITNDLAFIF